MKAFKFWSKIVFAFSLLFLFILAGSQSKQETKQVENITEKTVKSAETEKPFEAAYIALHKSGELKKRADKLWVMMDECTICPRDCKAKRNKGQKGVCGASSKLVVSSYHPHFGEERPLVGKGGSGTIFFSNCPLRCVFCLNWQISQGGEGKTVTIEQLSEMMLHLQKIGTNNINVVTPTHYLPHILKALDIAASKGLNLPLVYNTFGWEKLEILKMLDGVVDIYLPDFKYFDSAMANEYSPGAASYPEITKKALIEMNRQVGVAKPGSDGLVKRGLMIRHLVMPNHVDDTKNILKWISENLPKDTYLNIMGQYTPLFKAKNHPKISRRISRDEYFEALNYAKELGLTNLDRR